MTALRRAGAVLAVGLLIAGLAGAGPALGATGPQQSYAAACRAAGALVAATGGGSAVVPVAARGALPPTPLPIVISLTSYAVVARVAAVVYQGPKPSTPRRPPGFAGPIPPARCQVVRLEVTQVLGRVAPPSVLVVVKPRAPYLLTKSRQPHAGTFLLDSRMPFPRILGNYGPGPYAPADVAAALAASH